MKTLHIISGLSTGGAEMMLFKVLNGFKKRGHESSVISLGDVDKVGSLIQEIGITVCGVGMLRGRLPSLKSVLNLRKCISDFYPDLIQGWMYHGNLMAMIPVQFKRKKLVVWNVRQTLYDINKEKRLTRLVIKLNRFFSPKVGAIIYNSRLSAKQHEDFGFCKRLTVVIPNGFDTNLFSPNLLVRNEFRREIGISEDSVLIGLVARLHPMKDHENFIKAAEILASRNENVAFVLVGKGVEELNRRIEASNLSNKFKILGERKDLARINMSLDISVSASAWGEGFPNVVGEAMSCAVPCVVTDVGDSAWVVDTTGLVVQPRDSLGLANALQTLVMDSDKRLSLGKEARARVVSHFSIDNIVDQYVLLYQKLLNSNQY